MSSDAGKKGSGGDVIISVRGLGKRYVLGEELSFDLLQERFVHGIKRLLGRGGKAVGDPREFWALRDVEFDVREGEVLGVIGRNGAGKSTLLKVLSRITEPTEGEVRIRGRVASLLEVGTGFHKELTGRENVFLNGAILGMSSAEIRGKFDEIVEFAGVEKFIDTPVKRYSSGMTVRLAFSVAAHLEPEVLLIDEVLAVGDAEFQQRCLGKMDEVSRGGRTILFVSHNMTAVESLSGRGLLLDGGRVEHLGTVTEAVQRYLGSGESISGEMDVSMDRPSGIRKAAAVDKIRLLDEEGNPKAIVRCGDTFVVEVEGHCDEQVPDAAINLRFSTSQGQRLASCMTRQQFNQRIILEGTFRIQCLIRDFRFVPGSYPLEVRLLRRSGVLDVVDTLRVDVMEKDLYGTSILPDAVGGHFALDARWRILP